jgi:predicted transcriptional regulator of viral defense system
MDSDRLIAKIASDQDGFVTRDQALAVGLTDEAIAHRVRMGRWIRVHAGVYRIAGVPTSVRAGLVGACLAAGPGAAASHRGASAIWQLEGPDPAVEITVPRSGLKRLRDVRVHRRYLPPADLAVVDGLACTAAARTIIDLAAVTSRWTTETALEDALTRRLLTCAYLRRRLDAVGSQGRAGAGVIRELLADRPDRWVKAESRFERKLLRVLADHRLPRPALQYVVRLANGKKARLDAAYPGRLVGIEADSYRYRNRRRDWARNHVRNRFLIPLGWRIIPVTWDDLIDRPGETAALIAATLEVAAESRA